MNNRVMVVKKQFKDKNFRDKIRGYIIKYSSKKKVILLISLAFIVAVAILSVPVVDNTKKQYVVNKTEVEKVLASEKVVSSKKSIVETAGEKIKGQDIMEEDPFARWAILENHRGGYKIIYPYGFKIDYSENQVIVTPPSGEGKIIVVISNGSYSVNLDHQGAEGEQSKILLAAQKLIDDSFEFISANSNLEVDKQRFQQ